MIEGKKTITITNDGAEWTLSNQEARNLRDLLNKLIDPDQSPPSGSQSINPNPSSWSGSSINPGLGGTWTGGGLK